MQIQAINFSKINNVSFGKGARKPIEHKERTNEEVLQAQKEKLQKRKPYFTPHQKEILPTAQNFIDSGYLDTLKDYLEEAEIAEEIFKDSATNKLNFEEEGTRYICKKETGDDIGVTPRDYNINITALDENDEVIYDFSEKVRGGYSKYSLTTNFENVGKAEISRQGKIGSPDFYVRNSEERYSFAGKIDEEGNANIDFIQNFN